MTISVGLCTISAQQQPVEDVIALASTVGYDGVEIWGRDHVGDGSPATCTRIVEAANDHDIEIASYGSYLRCGSDTFDNELEHELTVADRLGTDIVRVWAGSQEYGDHDPDHWDRVVADLERVTERAGDYGLAITVEKHNNTLTHTLEGAQNLIEAIDDERCRLNYQPGFSIPARELETEARALAPLSNQLHLQTTRERTASDRAPLSESYYDLDAVLEPFLERDFEGYANVEFVTDERPYREAIEADLACIRSLLE